MKFYNTIMRPLLQLLTQDEKRKGVGIVALMIFNALLDFFSLASFLPLIFLMVSHDYLTSNYLISTIYRQLAFSSPASFIFAVSIGILIFTLIKNVIGLWITRTKANFSFSIGSHLSSRMLSQYLEMDYLKFTQSDFTKELNRIANLPIAFANNIIMPLASLLSEGLVFLILLCCVVIYDLKIFALLITILAPVGLLYRIQRNQLKKNSADLKEKYPLTLKHALQSVEGLIDIKASGKESFFKTRFDQISQRLAKTFVRDHTTQSGATRLTEVIAAFIICSIIIYSVVTDQNYQEKLLLLGIYAGASFRMIPAINRILNSILQIKSHEYLFDELKVISPQPAHDYEPVAPLPFVKTIELIKATFQYPNGTLVLNNASLIIHKGEKIALVGKSGTGKTKLLLLLLQFLKSQSGEILLDGMEISRKNPKAWRKIFGYVSQNPYLLDGTIAENIAFGFPTEEIDSKKIEQLVKELDLEELILRLPEGLSTLVGEKGIKLSGGQRQRIAVARVLYANAEVLLFDEVTNQLDAKSEQEILRTLEKVASQNKTIIMITHHDHLLKHFDRVLTLENGTLVEKIPSIPLS